MQKRCFLIPLLMSLSILSADMKSQDIYFFYSNECSYCSDAYPFILNLAERYPELELHAYEISRDRAYWEEFKEERGIHALSIPQTYIGDKAFFGFIDQKGPIQRHQSKEAYIAYSNQILRAVEKQIGRSVDGADPYVNRIFFPAGFLFIILLLVIIRRLFLHRMPL